MTKDVYVQALIGGALIGFSAFALMLFNGRVAGISGITFSAFSSSAVNNRWRWYFLAGLAIAPLLTSAFGYSLPESLTTVLDTKSGAFGQNELIMVLGGLLVGFGTQLGSGCTSGHGICGISRFSTRSIIATAFFMLSAILTVAVTRHILDLSI
ncbi:MAG: YeeE/YedE family protein [Paraglaciecola polaris]|uniref:YeeE/YedE family protein n=1 Tax=Paraglaciecola polaris TaxID=222814 RepID=UPI0030038D69|tara:strand:+ start:2523 stop:2984 length:462 start_codon:yes stop_codon:yes gene_type:complete